jgi:Spy/CpxP family protein refolding chaperone
MIKNNQMKKLITLTALLISFSLASFSQIQRSVTPKAKKDSAAPISNEMQGEDKMGRKEMMKELNLTRQQKMKLKEAMQDIKSQKAALDADTTLSAKEP